MVAALSGRRQKRKIGMFAIGSHQHPAVNDGSPVAAHQAPGATHQRYWTVRSVHLSNLSDQGERGKVGVDMATVKTPNVLNANAVDRIDLGDHQVDKTGIR